MEKLEEYGPSFRMLSVTSVVDIIRYKLERVSRLIKGHEMRVRERNVDTLVNIANYAIIGLILLWEEERRSIDVERAVSSYEMQFDYLSKFLDDKDEDYGSSYLTMKNSSLIEIMQAKAERNIVLADKGGVDLELIADNFFDICNYAILTASKLIDNERAKKRTGA